MENFLAYTVLGICLGSVYAIAATGLVVTYATSGVFNVAHGAVATMSALAYWQLHEGWHVPAALAIVLTIGGFAPAVGIFLELVVMRGLRDTNEVTRLVIPIAVLLAINGLATWIWFHDGSRAILPEKFFGERHVDVLGQAVVYHQVIGVVLAAVTAGGLWVLLYRSRIGVTMRATVDVRRVLILNGGRPDRASLASWAIGAALAGLAGVLLAPQQGALQIFALTLLVFDAYPARLVGGCAACRSRLSERWSRTVARVLRLVSDAVRSGSPAQLRNAIPAVLLSPPAAPATRRLRGAVVTRTRERFNVRR